MATKKHIEINYINISMDTLKNSTKNANEKFI